MNELIITNLITSISTLGAAFIGGYFMYKSNLKKEIRAKLSNKPSVTSNDVDKILAHNKYLEFKND